MLRRSILSRPAALGLLLILMLAARWIWVAGLGDYGWTYEPAARILAGQVYYADFPLLYGPLSHYTLAALMYVAGNHLLAFHLHLWLFYSLSLGAGLLVFRELGAGAAAQLAGVSLGAVMACPVFSWGHAFNFQAPFLAGVALICALRAGRNGGRVWYSLAGAAAALCIYSKQNVGLTVAALIPFFLPAGGRIAYASSLLITFSSIFGYFAWHAGAGEVWRQLFMDPASAKGGLLAMAARAVPRIVLDPQVPHRRWWEAGATAAAYAAIIPLTLSFARRPAGKSKPAPLPGFGAALAGGVALAIAASLIPMDIPFPRKPVIQPWSALLQLAYIFLVVLCTAEWRRHSEKGWRAVLLLIPAVVAVQEASNPNFGYSAGLWAPLICASLFQGGFSMRPIAAAAVIAGVYLLGTTAVGPVSYYGLCAYQRTYSLPANSPFHGLRAPRAYAELTAQWWEKFHPELSDRRTLWLIPGGGPYLAYGGRPVYNAPCYMPDSFPARLDRRLVANWERDPPDIVILRDDFEYRRDHETLTASYIRENLLRQHRKIWRSSTEPYLAIWKRDRPP